jgi:hypothetical protein
MRRRWRPARWRWCSRPAYGSIKAPQRSRPYALAGQGEGALSLGQSLGSGARWILCFESEAEARGYEAGSHEPFVGREPGKKKRKR